MTRDAQGFTVALWHPAARRFTNHDAPDLEEALAAALASPALPAWTPGKITPVVGAPEPWEEPVPLSEKSARLVLGADAIPEQPPEAHAARARRKRFAKKSSPAGGP